MAGAAVASIIAAFASLPKFEAGGIVPGTSYTGDKVLARLNSGEMVLNKGQQKALFEGGTGGGVSISLESARIQGADLYLALSNYMKRSGKKL